jgi:hypothetical protein
MNTLLILKLVLLGTKYKVKLRDFLIILHEIFQIDYEYITNDVKAIDSFDSMRFKISLVIYTFHIFQF